jgi:hypothetical protein
MAAMERLLPPEAHALAAKIQDDVRELTRELGEYDDARRRLAR